MDQRSTKLLNFIFTCGFFALVAAFAVMVYILASYTIASMYAA
jgi:hypothetical protein